MLRVYNTLSRLKEPFSVAPNGTVRVFLCGPTVYDYAHLGHARTYIAFDIINRYLQFLGYNVKCIGNITDVAQKVIEYAQEQGQDPSRFAKHYEQAFLEDMKTLGVSSVDNWIRASDYIPQMIAQVSELLKLGVAYKTHSGVYFEVNKYPKFGQLAGLTHDELNLRRLELCGTKKNPIDFSLWRSFGKRDIGWDSPFGFGRPGWHIEDTAISITNLGETYDIHGGASELIFPHHEAEIAQAETLTGKAPFVRFWLHTGLLSLKRTKMSKSLGNVITIREALKRFTPDELRYYFASFHYRQPINLTVLQLSKAKKGLGSLERNLEAFTRAKDTGSASRSLSRRLSATLERAEADFRNRMDDDFDTPNALRTLLTLSKTLRTYAKPSVRLDHDLKLRTEERFLKMLSVFGMGLPASSLVNTTMS